MEFLADLFGGGGIGTIFSGLSGLLGGYLTKRENRLTLIQQNSHDLAMAKVDQQNNEFELKASIQLAKTKLDIAEKEGEIEKDLIETEGKATVDKLDAQAFVDGIREANKPTGHPGVDKFRALTRPLITWSLYLFVLIIFIVLHMKVGKLVLQDTDLLIQLYVYLVQSVIYLFIMAVSWWFMSRGEKSLNAIKGIFSK